MCSRSFPMRVTLLALASVLMIGAASATAGGVRRPTPSPELAPRATAQVMGRVVGEDGAAVAGVTVIATHSRPDSAKPPLRNRTVKSDRDGQFRLALPPGEYVFIALDRELTGSTPALAVARALDLVLVVSRAVTSA